MGFDLSFLGFTLAEVLITLGIIGVVVVMTIPNLVKNYQEYAWRQAWKKEFSTISQAYERVKQDEGGDLSAWFNQPNGSYSTDYIIEKIIDKLSVIQRCIIKPSGYNVFSKVCGTNKTIVQYNDYKTLSGEFLNGYNLYHGQVILKNGAHCYFRTYTPSRTLVWVDVNGYLKSPNILGKDLFGLILTKDKVIPMGANGTELETTCKNTIINGTILQGFHGGDVSGAGCSAEYLYK